MSDTKKYAVNPSTGEVQEFDGSAWKPVDKTRVAKDKAGGVAVFDGAAWTQLGAPKAASQQDGPISNKYIDAVKSQGGSLAREGGLAGRYLLEGFSLPAEIIGNAANAAVNLGSAGINAIAGTEIPRLKSFTEGRDEALSILPSPENKNERVIGDMSRFISSVGGMAGLAKAGELAGTTALAPMGENIAGQAIAALTGGGAYGLSKELTDNPLFQAAAALGGGLIGGAGYAAADRLLPSNLAKAKPPATADIKASSQAAYQDAKDAGAIIGPQPLQKTNQEFTNWLAEYGYDPGLQPKVGILLDRMGKAGQQNITAEGVDILRKLAVNVARDGNPSERAIAGELIGRLDDMMVNLSPAGVVQGNADDAAAAFTKARDLWKTYRKSELIDNLMVKAEDQAMSTNSGGNVQNTMRQKLRSILDNPKTARLFSQEEQKAIRDIVRGTPTQNTLRLLGRLAPSSNAWLGILSTFAAPGVGVAVPVVGAGAKAGATALTNRSVNQLSNMVRSAAIPRQAPQAPAFDPKQLLVQALTQGTRPQLPNAYADFLLRSGGAAVPANGNPNTGSQPQP